MNKIVQQFYERDPEIVARELLGKYLIHKSPKGLISAMIASVDIIHVFAGHKSVKESGIILINLNQKKNIQMAITVGKGRSRRCILIRRAIPQDGIDAMAINFSSNIYNVGDLTRFPGSLCKSFGITPEFNGRSIVNSELFIEDRGIAVDPDRIVIKEMKRDKMRFSME